MCGSNEELPESIIHRLNYLITLHTAKTTGEPELVQNNKELFGKDNPEDFLWKYLGDSLSIDIESKTMHGMRAFHKRQV